MKKVLKILLTVLLLVNTSFTVNTVVADDGYELTGDTIFNDMFDLSPYVGNTGGHVAFLEATNPTAGTTEGYCIEPEVLTHIGDVYTPGNYSANDSVRQVMLNYEKNYNDNDLFLTKAGYYAVQLAIWGRIKGVDPASLTILTTISASQQSLAARVRTLASSLYNDSRSVNSTVSYSYDGASLGSSYNIAEYDGYIYFLNGDAYFRGGLIDLDEEGLAGEMSFTVTVDNGFVTDAAGNLVNTFGYGTTNGTRFRVYSPIGETSTTATITGTYRYTEVMTWDFSSGTYGFGQRMMSYRNADGVINRSVEFTHQSYTYEELVDHESEDPDYTASFTFNKTGRGVTDYSVSTVSTIFGEETDLYTLAMDTKALSGSIFGLYMDTDGDGYLNLIDETLYVTDEDGQFEASDIALEMNAEGKDYVTVCEAYASPGYGKFSDAAAVTDATTGYSCIKYVFKQADADVDGVISRTLTENDVSKTFTISVTLEDDAGNPISGKKVGILTTADMEVSGKDTIPWRSLVGYMTTGTDGKASFTGELPANQNYVVKVMDELSGTAEYEYGTETEEQEIELPILEQTDTTKNYDVDITVAMYADLTVTKTNAATDEPMEGYTFTLSDENNIFTGTTDENGQIVFEDVPYGTYELNENTEDDDFEEFETVTVTIPTTSSLSVENKPLAKSSFYISKSLNADYGEPVVNKDFRFNVKTEKYVSGSILDGTDVWNTVLDENVTITNSGEYKYESKFSEIGTYRTTVTEIDDSLAGITYSTDSFIVNYRVSRDTNDVLNVTASYKKNGTAYYSNTLEFSNSYKPDPVSKRVSVSKKLDVTKGLNTADDDFEFKIKDSSSAVVQTLTVKKNASTYYDFIFDKAGTYTYTIEETDGKLSGYTYDNTVKTLVFVVEDEDGSLAVDSLKINGVATDIAEFTNSYRQPYDDMTVTLSINKTIEGISGRGIGGEKLVLDEFVFDVTDEGGNSVGTITIYGEDSGNLDITIDEEGDYSYYISEREPDDEKWSYDETVYRLDVTVDDVKDSIGHYEISNCAVYNDDTSELIGNFTASGSPVIDIENEYVFDTISDTVTISKEVSNLEEDLADDFAFNFDIDGTYDFSITGEDEYEKTFTFDDVGEYTYVITEENVTDFENNSETYTVRYTVVQNGKSLEIGSRKILKGEDEVTDIIFTNTYVVPDGNYTIAALPITKKANVTVNSDEKFYALINGNEFEISTADENRYDITVNNVGTYTFEIKEKDTELENWTYDDEVYTVTVNAVQDGLGVKVGSLEIRDSSGEECNSVEFSNVYTVPEQPYTLGSFKVRKESNVTASEEFEYTVNGSAKTFYIGNDSNYPITVTKAGTYNYEIKETNLEYENWKFDTSTVYNIEVKVVQNERALEIESIRKTKNGTEISSDDVITFRNIHFEPVKANIEILSRFNLEDEKASVYVSEFTANGTALEKKITGNGNETYEFTFEKAGTYKYLFAETEGTDDNITYDKNTYEVTFTVTEDGENLKVEQDYTKVQFNNVFSYDPVRVNVEITKKVDGTPDKDSEFTFKVNDKEKVVISGNGTKTYYTDYDEPGVYMLKITEKNSGYSDYTFDESVYYVIVTVTDVDGELEADTVIKKGTESAEKVVFTNKYEKKTETSSSTSTVTTYKAPNTASE